MICSSDPSIWHIPHSRHHSRRQYVFRPLLHRYICQQSDLNIINPSTRHGPGCFFFFEFCYSWGLCQALCVNVRVCICVCISVCECVEVKQLVWTVESQLGVFGMTAHPSPPLHFRETSLFGFRYSECVSSFQPSLVFSMIILNSLFPSAGCFICIFFSSHCHPHHTALSMKQNSFRSPLFLPCPPTQGIQQYKRGQVWAINYCTSL